MSVSADVIIWIMITIKVAVDDGFVSNNGCSSCINSHCHFLFISVNDKQPVYCVCDV